MSRVFSVLLSRGLWRFIGVLLLLLLIHLLGPLLSIGQYRPLETSQARYIAMAVVLFVYFLRLLWRWWREGRLNAQLLGQLKKPANKDKAAGQTVVASTPLETEFSEALELLKRLRFGSNVAGNFKSWFSRQYVYQLPWYVFIGAPGAGKTTALVNSGLSFPLAERYGKAALRGVGGTRNCDWWFTDEAVLLDTAGRYTTHESDPVGDEREWSGFLNLLKRYRRRQPINGTLLTISVSDLLSSTEHERRENALVLRRRLSELRERLGIQFPVYVLITKMDLLLGFEEYFDRFSREELAQVWGFTLPYNSTQGDTFSLSQLYRQEYELLLQRLEQGLPDMMAGQADEALRARAYLLPQQFARLGPVLEEFLEIVFSRSRFDIPLVPRGVYFTSGRQGGERFDQVRDPLKHYLDVQGEPSQRDSVGAPQGKSYFLKNLLQELIFKEAGVAGSDERWERRMRLSHFAVYGLLGVLVVGLCLAWARSYSLNRQYVGQVQSRLPILQQQADQARLYDNTPATEVVPLLDMLNLLPQSEQFELDKPGWARRLGLYQGDKIRAAADTIYHRALEKIMAPLLARRIENTLESVREDDLEYAYEALRAYLMLHDGQRYEADYLASWLLGSLKKDLPQSYTQSQFDKLQAHIQAVTQERLLINPFPRNESLIQDSRERLARVSLEKRTYSRLRRLLDTPELTPNTVARMGGSYAASVFKRASGKPLTEGIPGLYSYQGYWTVFEPRIEPELQKMRVDDRWVLGQEHASEQDEPARLAASRELRRLYLLDYVKYWDHYLADIRLAEGDTLLEKIQTARTLSMADSPLKRLVQHVARETTLLRDDKTDARPLAAQARDKLNDTRFALEQMFGPVGLEGLRREEAGTAQVEEIVDRHFEQYRRLVDSTGGAPASIDATLGLLDEFYSYLTSSEAALRSASAPPQSDVMTKLQAEAGRLPGPLRDVLDTFSISAASELASRRHKNLGQLVNATIGQFCRQAIAGRYPFSQESARDVAPNDLARLFAPDGMMDRFFQEHLLEHVDMSGARWRFKPGMDGKPPPAFQYLDAFQRAAVIRDVFFSGGGSSPKFELVFTPTQMDAGLTQIALNADGQVMNYAHGPQVATTLVWPGPRGGRHASLQGQPQRVGSGLQASGPWAILRLLDQGSIKGQTGTGSTRLTFSLAGRSLELEVSANSLKSPWRLPEMRGFSCPGSQ